MPTYEYKCGQCGVFEVQQRITEPPLEKCLTCGQPVSRLVGRNINVLYRAGGFHTTDYRSEGYKQREKADSKPESTPAANKAADSAKAAS